MAHHHHTTVAGTRGESPPEWAMMPLLAQVAALEAAVYSKTDTSTIAAPSTGGGPAHGRSARMWEQWKYYCYGCGLNISHNTPNALLGKPSPVNNNAHDKPQWGDWEDVSQTTQTTIKTYKAALLTNLHPLGTKLATTGPTQYGTLDSAATDHFPPAS
eukprot:jgi/Psemu1/14647/gm1.14647_g